MIIRRFQAADAPAIAQLFHDTITTVNRQHYSAEQVKIWGNPQRRHWVTACSSRITYVAKAEAGLVGFAELESHGHIDCFYVHKECQGQGIGRQLYAALETQAQQLALTELWVEASITATPFFERQGFRVVQAQTVVLDGVEFINHRMQKCIAGKQHD